jgi:hypothetical protein
MRCRLLDLVRNSSSISATAQRGDEMDLAGLGQALSPPAIGHFAIDGNGNIEPNASILAEPIGNAGKAFFQAVDQIPNRFGAHLDSFFTAGQISI